MFHTIVAKGLFALKRARPDLCLVIALLCTRVANPNEDDWSKLVRMIKYLNGTKELWLTLSAGNLSIIKWYVDASFAVHADFKSHTGAVMQFDGGKGAIQSKSRKQKLNTESSCISELVSCHDVSGPMLWTKQFMESQGYEIEKNILYQDNKSTILLLKHGRRSSGQRTRAINVRYFFLTDKIDKGELSVEYKPTDLMKGDYNTKPQQGSKFRNFRDDIMGIRKIPEDEISHFQIVFQ